MSVNIRKQDKLDYVDVEFLPWYFSESVPNTKKELYFDSQVAHAQKGIGNKSCLELVSEEEKQSIEDSGNKQTADTPIDIKDSTVNNDQIAISLRGYKIISKKLFFGESSQVITKDESKTSSVDNGYDLLLVNTDTSGKDAPVKLQIVGDVKNAKTWEDESKEGMSGD